jgi:hypothetical protein
VDVRDGQLRAAEAEEPLSNQHSAKETSPQISADGRRSRTGSRESRE